MHFRTECGTRAFIEPAPGLLCIQIERVHSLGNYRMIMPSYPPAQKRFECTNTPDDPPLPPFAGARSVEYLLREHNCVDKFSITGAAQDVRFVFK
jgi:hypothetical protein